MGQPSTAARRRAAFLNRVHARLAAWSRPARAFVSQPEPRTVGHFARGRQLIAGNFLFAGHLIEAPHSSIWALDPPEPAFAEALQGFGWLDDLVAVGDARARGLAQDWTLEWIERFAAGTGPGWTPDLAGRRVMRWTHHAIFLLRGLEKDQTNGFYRSIGQQTRFLARRWRATQGGLARFEALTGLIYAALSLEGMEQYLPTAISALSRECAERVDAQGGILTRNPEELLEVFTLLTWATDALKDSDRAVPAEVTAAIGRIAPTLRALRHADGGLARFHGGGRGLDGRLDHALAQSGVRGRRADGLHMGYARLSAARTSIVVDASVPPARAASGNAHASTCAFELTSGRRPVVVNCGSGATFGEVWRRAGRATPSHSTLGIEGYSSSRFAREGRDGEPELLADVPSQAPVEATSPPGAVRLSIGHDGYTRTHGLTHARTIELSLDGRSVSGEDLLTTLDDKDQERFDRALDRTALQGIPFAVRFHLHPDADVTVDLGGAAVSIALKSGEIWVLRHDGGTDLSLEPSVYLEKGRLKPRAARQVVLSGRAMAYATRVRWSLAKAQESPRAIRDLVMDEAGAES